MKQLFQCLSFLNSGAIFIFKVRMFVCASMQLYHISRSSYLFIFWRNLGLKEKVTEPSTCVQDLLCHKDSLGFCENGEIKSIYLLQREATTGDI